MTKIYLDTLDLIVSMTAYKLYVIIQTILPALTCFFWHIVSWTDVFDVVPHGPLNSAAL